VPGRRRLPNGWLAGLSISGGCWLPSPWWPCCCSGWCGDDSGRMDRGGAVLALLVGSMMILAGRGMCRRHGWMAGKTIALDNVTLVSRRYKMKAKPDRLVRQGRNIIPEERKSAPVVRLWHRVQIGVTVLVIEDTLKVTQTHGFDVCGDRGSTLGKADAWFSRLRRWHAAPGRKRRSAAGEGVRARPADAGGDGERFAAEDGESQAEAVSTVRGARALRAGSPVMEASECYPRMPSIG
jgi:hypothetical protein